MTRSLRSGIAAMIVLVVSLSFQVAARPVVAAATGNPVPAENALPGTRDWEIDYGQIAQRREIEGYPSASSVAAGQTISFMVSVSLPQPFSLSIYRMGWYDGNGARLMTTAGPFDGSYQGLPDQGPGPEYLVEANWPAVYTLTVPADWVSGYYLVKFVRSDGFARYTIFVVRNDSDPAAIVMAAATTNWQAYNNWGGISLYGQYFYDHTQPNFGQAMADVPLPAAVSLNRPYDDVNEGDGAGQFFNWEFSMVRYLERSSRWVTYISDVDLQRPGLLTLPGRSIFVSVGHDEYWSAEMRATVTAARDAGMNLTFFSGNQIWWKIRFTADAAGVPNRRIYCYKLGGDPATGNWSSVGPPENSLLGSMSAGANWQGASDFVVADAGPYSWIYSGTALGPGAAIQGLVGTEYDATNPGNGSQPAGLQVIARGPTSDGGTHEAVMYTAASGAIVVNMGTFQWSWGLDAYTSIWSQKNNASIPVSADAQQITSNLLDRFSGRTLGAIARPPTGSSAPLR